MTTPPYQLSIRGKVPLEVAMVVKITAKRQVTFPAAVLDALGVGPGDRLELQEGPDGFLLRPQRIDFASLAPLRDKIRRDPGAVRPGGIQESAS